MTHLTLTQLESMKAGTLTGEQRDALVEHILGCEACAVRFRMMRALDVHLAAKQRRNRPWRTILAAAALLVAAVIPFLRRSPTVAPAELSFAEAETPSFALLDQVHELNLQAAMADWGRGTDLEDLIQLQNRR